MLLHTRFTTLQQASIYAHECLNEDCSKCRFLTVRFGSDPVITFTNSWTIFDGYGSELFSLRCPAGMLALGTACYHANCLKLQMLCGEVSSAFGRTTSKSKIVFPSSSSKITTCPDSMYVSGLECTSWDCIPTGLHCTELRQNLRPKLKTPLTTTGNRKAGSGPFSLKNRGLSTEAKFPIYSMACIDTLCTTIHFFWIERGTAPLLRPVEE